MKHVIFERMVELLRNVGVLEEELDLELFAESELEIRADDSCLVAMAKLLFPRERAVFYDAEFLYDEKDLLCLLARFATATGRGREWSLDNASATWDHWEGKATLEFDFRGEHCQWTFEQQSDWVSVDFYRIINDFTHRYLDGDFVTIPTSDQTAFHLYVPRAIVTEMTLLGLLSEEQGVDHKGFVDLFARLQQHGLLVDAPLHKQVCASRLFFFLEELLPERCYWNYVGRNESLSGMYVELLRGLAGITAGEWTPKQVDCAYNEEEQEVAVGFFFKDEYYQWRFKQREDTLEDAFYHSLHHFTKRTLKGEFFSASVNEQKDFYIYMPG